MVLDDDATGAVGGGSAIEEVGAGGGWLRGSYRGDGLHSSRLLDKLGTGGGNQGKELRVGMEAGHEGRSQLAGGLDVGKPMIADDETVIAVLVATAQYLVLTLGRYLGEHEGLSPAQVGMTRREAALVAFLLFVASHERGFVELYEGTLAEAEGLQAVGGLAGLVEHG